MPSLGSGIGQETCSKALPGHKLIWAVVTPMVKMVASGSESNRAALGCARCICCQTLQGHTEFGLPASASAQWTHPCRIKPCGSGYARWFCLRTLQGHTGGVLGVRSDTHPLAAVIKPCGYGCARWLRLKILRTYELGLAVAFSPDGHTRR